MKKLLSVIMSCVIISTFALSAYASQTVELYSPDGYIITVWDYEVPSYTALGWSQDKSAVTTNLYSSDGNCITVWNNEVELYTALGWSTDSSVATTTLYSADGSSITVWNNEVAAYMALGWYTQDAETTTLYSDGKTITVPTGAVAAYQAAGWLTKAAYNYQFILKDYNYYITMGDYEKAISLIETYNYMFEGTEYEYSASLLKVNAMGTLYNTINCPLSVCDYKVFEENENSKVNISFRNLTYNTVTGFKVAFDCYDAYGMYVNTDTEFYYTEGISQASCQKLSFTWTVKSNIKAASIANLRIINVTFADGTSWECQ